MELHFGITVIPNLLTATAENWHWQDSSTEIRCVGSSRSVVSRHEKRYGTAEAN